MKEKITCAQFIDSYYPNVDGVVNTVDNYAKEINKFQNYKCIVVAPSCPGYEDNFPYDIVRTSSIKLLKFNYRIPISKYKKRTKKVLKETNIDVIHSHSPFVLGKMALRYAKKNKIPIVTTFHSKYYDDFMQITKSKFISKLLLKYILNFYNKCDKVYACSSMTADTLKSYGYKKEVYVLENGTSFSYPENIEELKSKVKTMYNLNNKKTILFVGSLLWQKNIKLVLDTFKLLVYKGYNYQFIIVGDGLNGEAIKKYAEKINIKDKIIFTGRIYDKDILKGLYAYSDLFFFPSIYDNAPLVLREAAVMKLPSLLVKNTNASEVIKNDINGFTCSNDSECMAKKIIEIFNDENNLIRCGENAALTIPISWDIVVNKVVDEYNKVIQTYNKRWLENGGKSA